MLTDPYFYVLAIPVVLLAGMSKGGLGPAISAIAVPVLSFVISPVLAAAIMLPILFTMDLLAINQFRTNFSARNLYLLIPSGVLGIVIATIFMGFLPPNAVRVSIGIIVILFCCDYWFRYFRSMASRTGKPTTLKGVFWGMVSGFTSTQIHAGAPPLSIYLLPQNLDKVVLMGTMAIFFGVLNCIKIVSYSVVGLFSQESLVTSLVLLPLAPIGVKLGHIALNRFDQRKIYRFLYVALFLSALKLLYDGLM